jgi:hypothetical protein
MVICDKVMTVYKNNLPDSVSDMFYLPFYPEDYDHILLPLLFLIPGVEEATQYARRHDDKDRFDRFIENLSLAKTIYIDGLNTDGSMCENAADAPFRNPRDFVNQMRATYMNGGFWVPPPGRRRPRTTIAARKAITDVKML